MRTANIINLAMAASFFVASISSAKNAKLAITPPTDDAVAPVTYACDKPCAVQCSDTSDKDKCLKECVSFQISPIANTVSFCQSAPTFTCGNRNHDLASPDKDGYCSYEKLECNIQWHGNDVAIGAGLPTVKCKAVDDKKCAADDNKCKSEIKKICKNASECSESWLRDAILEKPPASEETSSVIDKRIQKMRNPTVQ
jgi:hypothetical protein